MTLRLHRYQLCLLLSMVTWPHNLSIPHELCSVGYVFDETLPQVTTQSSLFRARDKRSNQKVMVKVFKTERLYRSEKNIFNELKTLIDIDSMDKKTFVIDPKKREATWSHFVRLLHKCIHSRRPAMVVELLDETLEESIKRCKINTVKYTDSLGPLAKRPCVMPTTDRGLFGAYFEKLKVDPRVSPNARTGPVSRNAPHVNPTEAHIIGSHTSSESDRKVTVAGNAPTEALLSDTVASLESDRQVTEVNPKKVRLDASYSSLESDGTGDSSDDTSSTSNDESSMSADSGSVSAADTSVVPPSPVLCYPVRSTLFKSYAYQLLVAVGVLHGVGIFHLDLKPPNMGLTQDGTLKLFDFGLSRSRLHSGYVGTMVYSAPEMDLLLAKLVEDEDQVPKLDIWSIGCTIYEMFTGRFFSFGITSFSACAMLKKETLPKPPAGCKFYAAYFYLKWSFGSIVPTLLTEQYEAAEKHARERCPQIFSQTCTNKFRKLTNLQGHDTVVQQKLHHFKSNMPLKRARLDPSSTEPSELVELLSGLLNFYFTDRITIQHALTTLAIFKTFPHQDATKNKFGI